MVAFRNENCRIIFCPYQRIDGVSLLVERRIGVRVDPLIGVSFRAIDFVKVDLFKISFDQIAVLILDVLVMLCGG